MINLTNILTATEWLQQASDFCSTNWTRILGWISIPAIASVVITYILKFIFLAIQQKKVAKTNKPILEQLKSLYNTMENSVSSIENVAKTNFENGIKDIDKKIDRLFNQYNAEMKVNFEKIIGLSVEEALEKVQNILTEGEILVECHETEKVEQVIEEDVKPEITEEIATENTIETTEEESNIFAR